MENTLTTYTFKENNVIGKYKTGIDYRLINVIIIGLSDEIIDEKDEHKLHRLLEALFSSKITVNEKRVFWRMNTVFQ